MPAATLPMKTYVPEETHCEKELIELHANWPGVQEEGRAVEVASGVDEAVTVTVVNVVPEMLVVSRATRVVAVEVDDEVVEGVDSAGVTVTVIVTVMGSSCRGVMVAVDTDVIVDVVEDMLNMGVDVVVTKRVVTE